MTATPPVWLARLLLIVGSLTLTLGALELSVRLVWNGPSKLVVSKIGRQRILDPMDGVRYLYPARASYRQLWPDDPRHYFEEPDHGLDYRLNNYGFRDDDFSLRRGAKLRIAFLGDSLCFGMGVRDEHLFATLIEQGLNRRAMHGQQFEVYNFCLPGFNSRSEAALADQVVRYFQPDLIVVWFFLNDVNLPPDLYVGHRRAPVRFKSARAHSVLLDFVLSRLEARWIDQQMIRDVAAAYAPGHPGISSVADSFSRLQKVGDELGTPTAVAILPMLRKLGERYPFTAAHDAVAALARSRGFAVLDLAPGLGRFAADTLWVHPSDHHPNEIAQEAVARAMLDFLDELIREQADAILAGAERRRQTPLPEELAAAPAREWFETFARRWVRTSSRATGSP